MRVGKQWAVGPVQPMLICEVALDPSLARSLMHCLWLQWQWVMMTETVWTAPELFGLWPFVEKVCISLGACLR